MYYPVSAFIGFRYARASKGNPFIAFINFFSVAGITLGLAALITISSVMNGFEADLKTRILGITPHFIVDSENKNDAQRAQLSEIRHVKAQSRVIESEGLLQSPAGLRGVMVQGIEPQTLPPGDIISNSMLAGDLTDLVAGEYGIVLGRPLAAALSLGLGDKVRLISADASVYTPFGRIPSQRQFRITGLFDVGSELDDKVVLMHLHDSARLLRTAVQNAASTRLYLDDPFAWQEVKKVLDKQGWDSQNWRQRQGPLFDAVKMEKNMMSLMLLLIIAVAAFNIVSSLVMVVTEKKADIAILRTQGMTGPGLMRIFMLNGLYNGIKGTLFGLILGILLTKQLNNILGLFGVQVMPGKGAGLPVDIQWSQISLTVMLSVMLCVLATLYPAIRAIRVQPADALRAE
ncbi:lipoprotein-releasing ABC transporter permease subunit [Lacimicrobium alkaliphilum]|uniref:Transporter n=1 Tax=Lacimicrobium alkaliphilum TaxID=1526571 RepID=A0ABQ1R464_9ALTE|nr:lipoprotein-releasing ABC transporter permease subunit [Lacimicrobium alkaliphilum]GGD55450.1 transporter [Lacimicrobium alkaliphilum]